MNKFPITSSRSHSTFNLKRAKETKQYKSCQEKVSTV